MTPTLLLIRPEGHNDALMAEFSTVDWRVVEMPLTRIDAIDGGEKERQLVMDLDRFDHVIFVSQHAVRTALPRLAALWPQWPLGLRWYAVGASTAKAMEKEGIGHVVFPAVSGSAGLLSLEDFRDPAGTVALIVKGVDGLDDLENTLRKRGATVHSLTTYRRVQCMPGVIDDVASGCVVPVYNSTVLSALKSILARVPDHRRVLVAVSERIASEASAMGFQKVLISSDVGQDAVATCIEDARDWLAQNNP